MQVVWSKLALEDFEQNLNYLQDNWELKVIQNFTAKVERTLKVIQSNPKSFQKHKRLKCYIVPIIPQIILYYEITGNKIVLLRFWNSYKNPKKIKT
jgi:plasmid stabilization system protein ParE